MLEPLDNDADMRLCVCQLQSVLHTRGTCYTKLSPCRWLLRFSKTVARAYNSKLMFDCSGALHRHTADSMCTTTTTTTMQPETNTRPK
eukprot:m.1295876 g.1295876  ORF g.1295876 m.1295876 type:complete len:88 (-) comp24792_c0_seq6:1519-1782(-)